MYTLRVQRASWPAKYFKSVRVSAGFGLIELLIVLAIIAVILSVAIPSYSYTVNKTRRHDAELALRSLALAMQRHYASAFSFRGAASGEADLGPPAIFPQYVPLEGATKYYRLSITFADDESFELSATPIAPFEDDLCGVLKLNSRGFRGSATNTGQCWNGTLAYEDTER